jgi:hypothetical protein
MWSFIICTPPNIIRVIKSRRVTLEGHVTRMEETNVSLKKNVKGRVLAADGREIFQ